MQPKSAAAVRKLDGRAGAEGARLGLSQRQAVSRHSAVQSL